MQNPAPNTVDLTQAAALQAQLAARQQLKSGVNWFFLIAALSVVNSVILLTGGSWNFVIGLGLTQIVDAVAQISAKSLGPDTGLIVKIVGLAIDIAIASVFALFGFLAKKGYPGASWSGWSCTRWMAASFCSSRAG